MSRVGGGARWLAVHEVDEADSGRGRNDGDARSMPGMTEWSPPGGYPFLWPPYSTTVTNSSMDLRTPCMGEGVLSATG